LFVSYSYVLVVRPVLYPHCKRIHLRIAADFQLPNLIFRLLRGVSVSGLRITMMSPFRSACLRQWSATPLSRASSTSKERKTPWSGAAAVGVGVGVALSTLYSAPTPHEQEDYPGKRQHCQRRRAGSSWESLFRVEVETSRCDPAAREVVFPTGHTEVERFIETLEYNRCLLPDYVRRWETGDDTLRAVENTITWPPAIPSAKDIPALELDLKFCQKNPRHAKNSSACHKQQFRIGSYYVMQKESPEGQFKGYKIIKELAEQGHPDGMCLYGKSVITSTDTIRVDDTAP
jgi:hypothetical protein